MVLDREAVNRQAATFKPRRAAGVAGLVGSLHKTAPLKEWVTIESIALPPVPQHVTAADGTSGWTLWSLIAFARRDPAQPVLRVRPAWGVVQWQWPSGRVLRHVRVEEMPSASAALVALPEDAQWNLPMQAEALADRARFFEQLTRFVSDPAGREPRELAAGYARVLPPAALEVYRAVVPGARQWLSASARESGPRSAPAAGDASPSGVRGPSGASAPAPARAAGPGAGGSPAGTFAAVVPVGPGTAAAASPARQAPPAAPVPPAPRAGGVPAVRPPADVAPVRPMGAMVGPPSALPERIAETRALAEEFGLDRIASELDRLRSRLRRPGFRIAVVGEFGRGKSTLINRLLGTSVLPEGRHTPVPVVIGPGPKSVLELRYADGRTEARPLVSSSWHDLEELSGRNRPETKRLIDVRVLVDDPLLAALDIEIVDTPGVNTGQVPSAGDDTEAAAAADAAQDLLRRTVGASDAVLMVVSASAPLGLSETAFLEEEVIARHVPRITVVVSKLDTVDEEERDDILDYLGGRVRRISPILEVLAGPHREDEKPVAGVRERVKTYAQEGARRGLRDKQTTGQLLTVLEEMAEIAREGVAAQRLDAEERKRQLAAAEAEIDGMGGKWGLVRVELQKRRLETTEKFREHLRMSRDDLIGALRYEIERAPEPKVWWERDLPFRLRRELAGMAKKYEGQLHSSIAADIQWLDARMQEALGRRTTLKAPKVEALSTEFELGDAEKLGLHDLKSRKLAWRLGPMGLMAVTAMLVPLTGGAIVLPAGLSMMASGSGMILGEVKSTSLSEQQRQMAVKALDPTIDQMLNEFARGVGERLDALYSEVTQESVRAQQAWRQDRQKALAKGGAQGTAWQDLLTRTTSIVDRVGPGSAR